MFRPEPPHALTAELPVVRPDLQGYVLNGEWIDGFADRAELPLAARRQLATLAAQYAPEHVSDGQVELLREAPQRRASDLLRALAEDEADIDEAFGEGLFSSLSDKELRRARDQEYPISISSLSELSGATQRQLRYWEDQGLLRSYSIGAHRRYLHGGVLRATVLAKEEQYVRATLGKTLDDPARLVRLLGLVLRGSNEKTTIAIAAREFIAVGEMLDRVAKQEHRPNASVATRTRRKDASSHLAEVSVRPKGTGWGIVTHGARGARSTHPTQAEAVRAGREIASETDSILVIYRRDGTIRTRTKVRH